MVQVQYCGTHDVALGGLTQQPSECDDRGHAGAVEKENGGQALQVQGITDVAPVVWDLPLHIHDQATKDPDQEQDPSVMACLISPAFLSVVFNLCSVSKLPMTEMVLLD